MPFLDISKITGVQIPKPFERELKIVMSPESHPGVVKDFTFLYSTLAPNGGCTDLHSHVKSGELMIFISGQGKAWLDGEEHELKPGVAMYAPPGAEHKTLNTGDEPLVIACVFTPPASPDYVKANIKTAEQKDAK